MVSLRNTRCLLSACLSLLNGFNVLAYLYPAGRVVLLHATSLYKGV